MHSPAPTSRALSALLLLALLPAAVAPFVTFFAIPKECYALEFSPLAIVGGFYEMAWTGDWEGAWAGFTLIALPFFLGLLIVAWQLGRIVGVRVSRFGRAATRAVAGASALMSLGLAVATLLLAPRDLPRREIWGGWLCTVVLIATIPLLEWLQRHATDLEALPVASLACAYLAHAALYLPALWRGLFWWLVLSASIALVAQLAGLVLRTCAGRQFPAPDSIFHVTDGPPSLP